MATYATPADLTAYLTDHDHLTAPEDEEAERILSRAERDVDRVLGPYPVGDAGLKLDPQELTEVQRAALSRATCAQAAHRIHLGEDFFTEPDDIVTGDVRVLRAAERISIRVSEELAGHGILKRSGTVAPEGDGG